jgi:hypothetical protein
MKQVNNKQPGCINAAGEYSVPENRPASFLLAMRSFFAVVIVIIVFAHCTKLDVKVESQYTSDNFPTNAASNAAAIGPLYTQLAYSTQGFSYAVDYWRMQEFSTEEAIIPARDGNYDDGGQYRFLHLHTWTGDHPNVKSNWEWGFGGINAANRLVSLFTAAPESPTKAAAFAEIKTMRSLFYFFMMDLYGNVPIIDTFPVAVLPGTSPRAKVFEYIESNLKSALPNLTTKVDATTYGRATRWMAFAMLEKLYLNAEYYTGTPRYADAVAMADSILINAPFSLDADYNTLFAPDNGPAIKETIFAIPYDANLIQGNHFTRYGLITQLQAKYSIPFRPSVAMSTIPDFYANFNLANDVRNATWLVGKQFNFDGSPIIITTTKKTLDNTFAGTDATIQWQVEITPDLTLRTVATMDVGNDILAMCKGIRSIKYYPDKNANPSTRYQNNDVPVFRLADVMMMKAEAVLRGATATTVKGELQTPVVLFNKIRSRAKAPTVTAVTLADILPERAREFAWEAWRRNDLIRFGKYEGAWGFKTSTDITRRIYPVPTTELALNPNLKQNPGY